MAVFIRLQPASNITPAIIRPALASHTLQWTAYGVLFTVAIIKMIFGNPFMAIISSGGSSRSKMCVLLLCAVPSFANAEYRGVYLPDLPGCYVNEGNARSYGLDRLGPLQKTYSHLVLKAKNDGTALVFETTIVGDNFHVCSASGELEVDDLGDMMILRRVPDANQIEEEQRNEMAPCRLQLIVTPRRLVFYDPNGSACHEYFMCGTRSGIAGASFDRKKAKATKKNSCPPS